MGFSHIHRPNGINSTLCFQGCVLEMASSVGTVGRIYSPRKGKPVRCFQLAVTSLQVNQWLCSINDLFYQRQRQTKRQKQRQRDQPIRQCGLENLWCRGNFILSQSTGSPEEKIFQMTRIKTAHKTGVAPRAILP